MSATSGVSRIEPDGIVVVAGVWVRAMAQSARRAGWRVIALDVFGDRDTRDASVEWHAIGDATHATIEPDRLRETLRGLEARHGRKLPCILGSGFDGRPTWLDAVGAHATRIGVDAACMASVRDPATWFGTLDRVGLAHPPVRLVREATEPSADGWLVKSLRGSGGWHIRPARHDTRLAPHEYLQQRVDGASVSALFLADGVHARIVGVSRQDVRPRGAVPFVYHGAIGPMRDDALRAEWQRGLDALVPAFGVVGLASVDGLADARGVQWLELNPRPSATMVLYDDVVPQGLMHAHVRACAGELPDEAIEPDGVVGHRIVYADEAIVVDAARADALARRPWCHDVPLAGAEVAAGAPLCSVSARASDASAVMGDLDRRSCDVWRVVGGTMQHGATPVVK